MTARVQRPTAQHELTPISDEGCVPTDTRESRTTACLSEARVQRRLPAGCYAPAAHAWSLFQEFCNAFRP